MINIYDSCSCNISLFVQGLLHRMATTENVKLKKLLANLLHPEFKIRNETYLATLLDHLKESHGELLDFNILSC